MSNQEPPKWFDDQGSSTDSEDQRRRKAALLEELPRLMKEREQGRDGDQKPGRAQNFYPYLLVRSVLGDRGDRPINTCFWESPDIWTAPGAPADTPAIPPDHGGEVKAGQPTTLYAHVWNLGFAPLAGVLVEFYWFNPSLAINGTNAHLIGQARCELAGRGMQGSHKLVKCPVAWIPVVENGGHECLIVRVSGIGDPLGANQWLPWKNRHVAQRNISVVAAGTNVSTLLEHLDLSRLDHSRVQLIQLGPREGELARHIISPHLKVSPVDTHVLGEISLDGKIQVGRPTEVPAGMLAPVHPLAAGGPAPVPKMMPLRTTRIVDPNVSIRTLRRSEKVDLGLSSRGRSFDTPHIRELLKNIGDLHAGTDVHDAPRKGEAHVIRIASYDGDQLVGGYTMVVTR